MNISANKFPVIFSASVAALAFLILLAKAGTAQNTVRSVAPFIVRDTSSDSPGTNNVTRIVTITAKVGGSPPPARQWKVDHGHGFETIAGATNEIFRIGNAQPADSGLYSLFATNAAGQIHTTQVPLVVIEVED
jgi:hypothetical protein